MQITWHTFAPKLVRRPLAVIAGCMLRSRTGGMSQLVTCVTTVNNAINMTCKITASTT